MDKGFFRPSLRAVGFSLRFKNSGHVITFLCFCSLQNTDRVIPFWLFPPAAVKSGLPVSSFSRLCQSSEELKVYHCRCHGLRYHLQPELFYRTLSLN